MTDERTVYVPGRRPRRLRRGLIRHDTANFQAAIRLGDVLAWSCAHHHVRQDDALNCASGALAVFHNGDPPDQHLVHEREEKDGYHRVLPKEPQP